MTTIDDHINANGELVAALASTNPQRKMIEATRAGARISCASEHTFVLVFRGPLSVPSMEHALAEVVRRHEALRTRLAVGSESHEILDSIDVALPLIDLRAMSALEREREIAQMLNFEARTAFDLNATPLWRASLVREQADLHRLILTIHGLVSDIRSSKVIFDDLAGAYSAVRAGVPYCMAPATSYREFVRNKDRAAPAVRSDAADVLDCQQHSAGAAMPDLPLDHVRRPMATHAAAHAALRIEPSLSADIRAFGVRHGCPLAVTLLAGFEILVAKLSGCAEFVISMQLSGGAQEGTECLVANRMAAVPLQCKVNEQRSFSELLQAVGAQWLAVQAHRREPQWLGHDAPMAPSTGVIFAVDEIETEFDFAELAIDRVEVHSTSSDVELAFNVLDTGRELELRCSYNANLLKAATVVRWLGHFRQLLLAATSAPEAPVARVSILTDAERADLLNRGGPNIAYSKDLLVHQLVEHQVRRTPRDTALVAAAIAGPQVEWTYADLESRANRLAHLLRHRGIGRHALVGLCLNRSGDMVVTLLAVLKTGAAYVPLDPGYPAERLQYMAQDARINLLVTESTLVDAIAWAPEHTVLLDSVASDISSLPASSLAPNETLDARPEDPAYVIYTSGSTGRPKGVVVPHRAVVNFLSSMAADPGLVSTDRLLAVTTLSFDIAVLELLLPLVVGACAVIANREQATDGMALRKLMTSCDATVMQATPTTWRMLIDAGWRGSPAFKALVGGESLPMDLAKQLLERTRGLWNMYGPTETTVWSTVWKVASPEQGISIGRAIANTRIRVLDAQGQLTPIGVSGEICIGGAGVALGYLGRPELTAERFIDDPFQPGCKLYRTGDRGRWRDDGLLDHQGRLDSQVKVRGHRIELGEIESVLASHPQVACTVVLAREDQPGDQRLVAYVVPRATMPASDDLRSHLRHKLPAYMLPQHFVRLDRLPTLPNGKIDRRQLPAPSEVAAAVVGGYVTPRTNAEVAIAEIWKRLLGIDRVGATDNFFDLGGHSLVATRAVDEIRTKLNIPVSVPQLLMETLAQIAGGAADASAAPLPRKPAKPKGWLERLTGALSGSP